LAWCLTIIVRWISATISRESPVRLPGGELGRIAAFRARWNGAFIPIERAADDKVRSPEMEYGHGANGRRGGAFPPYDLLRDIKFLKIY